MTKILLTRHGHVEGILPERFRGRAELALTRKGVAEAEALAARIARAWRPAVVYTSAQNDFTVNPAPLTITASSEPMTYGANAPAIAPLYSGFEDGDSAASLSSQATCTTTADCAGSTLGPLYGDGSGFVCGAGGHCMPTPCASTAGRSPTELAPR